METKFEKSITEKVRANEQKFPSDRNRLVLACESSSAITVTEE